MLIRVLAKIGWCRHIIKMYFFPIDTLIYGICKVLKNSLSTDRILLSWDSLNLDICGSIMKINFPIFCISAAKW